jgi:hypothetical protein
MTISRLFCAAFLCAFCVACGDGGSSAPPPSQTTPDYSEINTLSPSGTGAFTVGDVEFNSEIDLRLDPRSVTNQVQVDETLTELDKLTRVEANVFAPHPEEFWISVNVYARENYPEHAIVYDTKVYVDNIEVLRFKFVGGDTLKDPHPERFNLLEFTDGVPETTLVHAKSDIVLYKDTDEAAIDAENPPTADSEEQATVLSNTLRVNFRQ